MRFKTDGITINYELTASEKGIIFSKFPATDYAVLGDEDFLRALSDKRPGETLHGVVNDRVLSIIVQQYGVLL